MFWESPRYGPNLPVFHMQSPNFLDTKGKQLKQNFYSYHCQFLAFSGESFGIFDKFLWLSQQSATLNNFLGVIQEGNIRDLLNFYIFVGRHLSLQCCMTIHG